MGSPQASDRVNAADDIAVHVGRVCLPDVGGPLAIAEDRQRLLEFSQVFGADQDGDLATIARDDDTVVLTLDPIDELGKVVSY